MTWLPPRCYTTWALKDFIDSQASIETKCANIGTKWWAMPMNGCALFMPEPECTGCQDHLSKSGMIEEYERRYYAELGERGYISVDKRIAREYGGL